MLKFIAIYKPKGVSSFKALAEVKKYFGTKKVGHMGTLDPLAEGVLAVALGQATRLIEFVETEPKEYLVEIFFGAETETFDSEGVDMDSINAEGLVDGLEISQIIESLGVIKSRELQAPPIYSAIKINGVRAYDLARKGEIVQSEIKEKKVTLYSFEVLEFQLPLLKLKLSTSSGYYVRSLVRDLGILLGVKCFMYSLVRTKVGLFSTENCSDLKTNTVLELEADKVLKKYPRIELSSAQYAEIQAGKVIEVAGFDLPGEKVYAYFEGKICSICKYDPEYSCLKPIKNFSL